MDSFQQHQGYMRPPQPPPPHTADPQHHHQPHFHQIPPPPPPQGPWYSTQFQYHPSQTPSPPPQWQPAPPPPPPPPSNPYSYHPSQFPPPPPPRSHLPPPQYPPHSHIPQPYPQEWSHPSWAPSQGYPAHKTEEDWAAKARAWADAMAAMENQNPQPQSHFSPAGRLQEQSHYHDQYQQPVDSRYSDVQNQPHPSSSYQQFSYLDPSMQRLSGHPQEAASVNVETTYASDGHPYSTKDGTSLVDPTVPFEQGNLPANPSVHQQEVPSSYSSVAGKEAADQIQQSYAVLPLSSSSSQEQRPLQASMHVPLFASGSHSVDSAINPADQPLDFAPRFSRDNDLQMQSTYNPHDSGASMNAWAAPVAPGVGYPPISPMLPSGPQHDPSITTHVHAAPPFGRFPGPGLPSTIPPSGAPFALGTGATIHPTAAFSADAYGVSGVPERPKKAPVPNWLREEIKKNGIAAPSAEHVKEEATFVDDRMDKSFVKSDETDSKSIDSSRSAEDEEDDEDQVEAARTAAITQEIKKVLTEVLLKVTDELFDEVATKVLNEDDLAAEVGHNIATSNHKGSASPPPAPVPKASAKILVPVKSKELENDDSSEKSDSSSPGDVLGLGNYGSDADDGVNEIENSSVPTPAKDSSYQSGIKKPSEDVHDVPVNSSSQLEEDGSSQTNLVNNLVETNSLPSRSSNGATIDQSHDDKVIKEFDHSHSSKVVSDDIRDNKLNATERSHDRLNGFSSKNTLGMPRSEPPGRNVGVEKATDDHPSRESRRKSEKNYRRDRSSEDFVKDVQGSKSRTDEKGDENHRRKDDRHQKKERTDYSNEAKERTKEHNLKHGEKVKEESRKRSSHFDVKDDRKEAEKSHRSSAAENTSRKKEHTKDKGEHKSRQKDASNPDKHKRRRSSSVSSRGRISKDHIGNHASDSSGEGSDGSKRKLHSRKRNLSPSPVRSKRRQVSRSPHSKRSQRRHSPYSSIDTSRGRRSRSRSPGRRQR